MDFTGNVTEQHADTVELAMTSTTAIVFGPGGPLLHKGNGH